MKPDTINGLFEFCGAAFLFLNVIKMYKDKKLKGYNWRAAAFFTSWGIWNLYYYPYLNQWLSFLGGCALVLVNTIWLMQIFYYSKLTKPFGA